MTIHLIMLTQEYLSVSGELSVGKDVIDWARLSMMLSMLSEEDLQAAIDSSVKQLMAGEENNTGELPVGKDDE